MSKRLTPCLQYEKIAVILLALVQLYWVSRPAFTARATHKPPAAIIHEKTFIHIIRDLELLHSWLRNSHYPPATIDLMRHQNHQKILALYKIDPQAFQESVQYYLGDGLDRALKVYKKVCLALEEL